MNTLAYYSLNTSYIKPEGNMREKAHKPGCQVRSEISQLFILFSTYENVLKLCHKCLWLPFLWYQQRLQPVWGEGGPAPCSPSTSSLPQHTDTARSSMIMQLRCRQFIEHASQLSYSKQGEDSGLDGNEWVSMICIHSTGFSKQCWMHQLRAQAVWLHLVLAWKELPKCFLIIKICRSHNK